VIYAKIYFGLLIKEGYTVRKCCAEKVKCALVTAEAEHQEFLKSLGAQFENRRKEEKREREKRLDNCFVFVKIIASLALAFAMFAYVESRMIYWGVFTITCVVGIATAVSVTFLKHKVKSYIFDGEVSIIETETRFAEATALQHIERAVN